jgi:HEAT repeat protein
VQVQERAAAARGRLRDRRAVDPLIGAVKNANWRVQVRAAVPSGARAAAPPPGPRARQNRYSASNV